MKGAVVCDVRVLPDEMRVPHLQSYQMPEASFVSKPLEDWFPFLPRRIVREYDFAAVARVALALASSENVATASPISSATYVRRRKATPSYAALRERILCCDTVEP